MKTIKCYIEIYYYNEITKDIQYQIEQKYKTK